MVGGYSNSLKPGASGVGSGRVLPQQPPFSHCSSMD